MSMQTGPITKTRPAFTPALRAALIGCTAFIGLNGAALAQTPGAIEDCRENSADKDARIACLEAAIVSLTGGEKLADGAQGEDAVQTADAAEEADPNAPTGLGAEQVAARIERESPDEESRKEKKEDETLTASVEDYAVAADTSYILFLDNGHVWRQTGEPNAQVRLYPGKDYTVTVKKGLFSGYRLTINEIHRTFVAERIK